MRNRIIEEKKRAFLQQYGLPSEKSISQFRSEVTSYMNNTKWLSLMDTLTASVPNHLFLYYKIIGNDQIQQAWMNSSDHGNFFCEPVLYKMVEWIEIPRLYEDYINDNNRKAGRKIYEQDLLTIEKAFTSIGQFQYEANENTIINLGI